MLRTFELRLKPKAVQRAELARILADSAETYNAAAGNAATPGNCARSGSVLTTSRPNWTELRRDPALRNHCSRHPAGAAAPRGFTPFQAFFQRVKADRSRVIRASDLGDRYDSFAWHFQNSIPTACWFRILGASVSRPAAYWLVLSDGERDPLRRQVDGENRLRHWLRSDKRVVNARSGIDVGLSTLASALGRTEMRTRTGRAI